MKLPTSHYCLQVVPTLSATLATRATKTFVTVNNQRLRDTPVKAGDTDSRRPLYDVGLAQGLNRIEVEVIAGPARGAPRTEVELERITAFVLLQ